jgi:drug/metabolite transporter (DMT)-like permease
LTDTRRLASYAVPFVLLVSLQYQFTKDGLAYASPVTFMGLRYLIAASASFAFARRFRPILNRDTLLLAAFTWSSTILWASGLQTVSPAQSAVLSYTMPLFAIPFSVLILGESTSRLGWAGAMIGFVGVAIYGEQLTNSGGSLVGTIFTVSNAVFWALYTIYFRKVRNQDALATLGTQFLIGAAVFFVLMPVDFRINVSSQFLFDLGFVSLLSGFGGFYLWEMMTKIETIGRLTTLAFAVPAVTMVTQAILTGELPGIVSLFGVALMFFGIYISRMHEKPVASRLGPAAGRPS